METKYNKAYNITDTEVKDALDKLEINTLYETGVKWLSGGFATAEIFNYDDEYFDIELVWGVQNDCENRVNTEQYIMNRYTLEIID